MTNWAVFNDEGKLADYGSKEDAEAAAKLEVERGDQHAYAGIVCASHDEQCAWSCEECNAEDEDESSED